MSKYKRLCNNDRYRKLYSYVPDWLQTEVAIKLNSQTDNTECLEAITELVNNNTDKFSKRKGYAFNVGDKFSIGKKLSNQADPTQSSQSIPATYEAAAANIKAEMLPILKMPITISRVDPVNSKVNPLSPQNYKKQQLLIESDESKSKSINKNYKISQYHHLEEYDFSINKDSLYILNSFYN
ncbi:hypothetical protein ACTFIZ_000219 [Dictyostelium cf. discoideum]